MISARPSPSTSSTVTTCGSQWPVPRCAISAYSSKPAATRSRSRIRSRRRAQRLRTTGELGRSVSRRTFRPAAGASRALIVHDDLADVYRVTDTRLKRLVAIKFVLTDSMDPAARARFRCETQLASGLNPLYILTVHLAGPRRCRLTRLLASIVGSLAPKKNPPLGRVFQANVRATTRGANIAFG
jgi:hypothetical protein